MSNPTNRIILKVKKDLDPNGTLPEKSGTAEPVSGMAVPASGVAVLLSATAEPFSGINDTCDMK